MTTPNANSAASDAEPAVGIIGFGLVGAAYSQRLADSGRPPYVVPRDPDTFSDRRGITRGVLTVDQLVRSCRVAVVCVYSTDQVIDVLEQFQRSSHRPGAILDTVLCATTLDPAAVDSLAEIAAASGLTFLEYPVSGTSAQIRDGQGLGLLSGDEAAIEAHHGLIQILTPCWHIVGPRSSASLAKLAVNLVLEVNRSALAEGLVLASRLGLDTDVFLAVLKDSAAYSRVMDGKAAKMLSGDFSAEGRAEQSLKDVVMMLAAGQAAGQVLPLASTQAALLRAVVDAGDGALDSSVVYQTIAAMRH